MKQSMMHGRHGATLALLLGAFSVAQADVYLWTGDSGVDYNMSTSGNWSNMTKGVDNDGPANTNTDVLVFGYVTPAARRTPIIDVARTNNGVIFLSDASAYTFDGTASKLSMVFAGTVPVFVQNSANNQTLGAANTARFNFQTNLTLVGSGTGKITSKDGNSGSGGFTKIGDFDLQMDYASSYTGPTVIKGGAFLLSGGQAEINDSSSYFFQDTVLSMGA